MTKLDLTQFQKQRQTAPAADPNDIEYKFFQYITTLKKKGFFNGVTQGSSGTIFPLTYLTFI